MGKSEELFVLCEENHLLGSGGAEIRRIRSEEENESEV